MPAVVAWAATEVGLSLWAAGSVATGTFLVANATIIGYVVSIGGAVAYSSSQNSKMRNAMKNLTDTGRNVMMRDPLATQRKLYGQIPTAGPLVMMHTTGTKNEYLHAVEVIASHECQELGTVYFENQDGFEEVPLDGTGTNGGGNATGKYAGYFFCNKYLGTPTQTADAVFVASAPTKWTANHRLRGHAYLYLQFKYNADLFPNGIPVVRVMTKGAKLLDPRVGITIKECDMVAGNTHVGCDTTGLSAGMLVVGEGALPGMRIVSIDGSGTFFTANVGPFLTNTTADLAFGVDAWSDNGVLCIADYLADFRFGKGIPWSRINRTDLPAEANIADESVVTTTGSEARYTINGLVTANADALPEMVPAIAGKVVDTGGVWAILAGAYRTPTVDFTDADVVGAFNTQTRQSMRESYSGVRGTYIAAVNNWQPADFPAVKNATYAAQDGNRRRWKDVAYAFTTSAPTAQRLAKIDLERGRQQIVVQALYKLKATQVQCGDTVRVTRAALGWVNKEFEVLKWSLKPINKGQNNFTLAIMLTLRETASGVWSWADGEETEVDLAANTTLPNSWSVPTPTGLTLTVNVPYVSANGTVIPRILVQWNTPNNIYVESGGKVEVEYREAGIGNYTMWSRNRGDTLQDYIVGVKVGTQYDVRIRFINELGVHGAYATATSAPVGGDTTVPNAGSSLTVTANPGYILIEWDPSTTNQVNEYLIYRSVNAAAFALLASVALTQYNDPDVVAGSNYSYQIRAVTASEVQSADLGPSTPVVAVNAAIGAAVPSNPTASTNVGPSGTYDATDGSVFAFATVRVPALPTNALWQNLLYRRNGATEWLIASGNLKNAVNADIRLDDLSPGVTYDIATQAWSPAGASAVVAMTGTSLTASTKGSGPAALTGGALSADGVPAKYIGSTVAYFVGTNVSWNPSTEKDFAYYEIKATTTNADAAVDYSWTTQDGAGSPARTTATSICLYNAIGVGAGYVRIRAVNASGVASAWAYVGNANSAARIGAGTIAPQNANGVSITGGAISGITDLAVADGGTGASSAAGARVNFDVLRSKKVSHVVSIGDGTAPDENFTVNHGFGVSFTHIHVQVVDGTDWENLDARHDYANGSNDANNTVIRCRNLDGTNIAAGNRRFTITFFD